MGIRDDDGQDDYGWKSAGPGLLMRFLPKPVGEVIPLERVQVSHNVTTSETLKQGKTMYCDQCAGPIAKGSFPTPGHLFGTLTCQTCSEEMGRPSSVGKGKRSRGRPRKYEQEGS